MRKAWQMGDSVCHGCFKSSIAVRDGEDRNDAPFRGAISSAQSPPRPSAATARPISPAPHPLDARGGNSKSGAVALTSRRGNCYV